MSVASLDAARFPGQPAKRTPAYRYLFAELLTGNVLADVRLDSVSFSDPLNGAGQFSGRLNLAGREAQSTRFLSAVTKGKTGIWVLRSTGGAPTVPWAGIYSDDDYDSSTHLLTITGVQVDAWLEGQEIEQDLVYIQVDQYAIARGLIDYLATQPNGDIRIRSDPTLSGIRRDRTYLEKDRDTIGELLKNLSGVIEGPSFNLEGELRADGSPGFRLRLGPQDLSPTVNQVPLVFDFPGNIVSYRWPETSANMLTIARASSELEDGTRIAAAHVNPNLIADGFPRRVHTINKTHDGVIFLSTLQEHASTLAFASRKPAATPVIVVHPNRDPEFGSYLVGDYARVRIRDQRFPNGLDVVARITQIDARPPGRQSDEQITLALDLN